MEPIRNIEQVIERVGDLPAIPELVAEVLRMTNNPLVDMTDLTEVIERDPALTAKILRVSNSPYYGMKQYVGTLKLALVILGVREVRNIVMGVSVFDALQDGKQATLMPETFWSHSFFVAGLSKQLGATLRMGMQGEAFIGGLLHDIGKLVLLRQLQAPYSQMMKVTGGHSTPLCEAETAEYGFTHADAAAALTDRWNFPKTLTDAIHHHHPREELSLASAKDPRLAAIVRVANLAAYDTFADDEPAAFSSGADAEAWAILDQAPAPIEPSERFHVVKTLLEELKNAPTPTF